MLIRDQRIGGSEGYDKGKGGLLFTEAAAMGCSFLNFSALGNCKNNQGFPTEVLLRLQMNFCYFVGSKLAHDTRDTM